MNILGIIYKELNNTYVRNMHIPIILWVLNTHSVKEGDRIFMYFQYPKISRLARGGIMLSNLKVYSKWRRIYVQQRKPDYNVIRKV